MTAPTVGNGQIRIDAYTGAEAVTGVLGPAHKAWALSAAEVNADRHLVPNAPDPSDWTDPRVGWGVILPELPGADPATLANGADAPEPIRALIKHRKGKVLRYRTGTAFGDWALRDHAGGGDLLTAASPPGSGPLQLPMYLLICGSPAEIPWRLQYSLNPVRQVGRLDLTGEALANYVAALVAGWSTSATRYDAPVVWSVDHGGGDITTLMREAIGGATFERLSQDADITAGTYIDGSKTPATGESLAAALAANRPSLVVTTSHGMTGPLDNIDMMRANLGKLVDQSHRTIAPETLLGGWQPDGAIWFAQACCSAGSNSPSAYRGLFQPESLLDGVLNGVSQVGAITAPLPQALLGAAKPLRAFIGHVEPTFDWTLSFPPNRQHLTADLQTVLYERMCGGQPVGLAMSRYYQAIGNLLINHGHAVGAFNTTVGQPAQQALDMALYSKVTAYDRASTVILGDPTAAIPLPA